MPIYEYACNACNEIFALLQWTQDEKDTACPRCGSQNIKKLVSQFSCSSPAASGFSSGGSSSGFSGGG
ncbi:MAG: Zinc ribbon domain [Nitrospirae bacterium]|jgi:putative FmdB family regulatory protein|nr:Zinc ribbon domain [Nitrospirota bacterium]